MPFENEHACRLRDPDEFQPRSFRRMARPKGVTLVIARPKGKTTTATQALRYDKATWTAEQAKADCGEKGGTFEAAAKESELPLDQYEEASWQDIISLEEAILSFNDKRERLATAVRTKFNTSGERYGGPYIRDIWDASLVYEDSDSGKHYKVGYTISEKGVVELGEPKEVLVQTTYTDLEEALTVKAQVQGFLKQADALLGMKGLPDGAVAHVKSMRTALHKTWSELSKGDEEGDGEAEEAEVEIGGDFISLTEAIAKGGETVHIKIIQPGWGSSGYYSADLLKRDAPVYKEGTKMYWDHPTQTEEQDRPERSLRDLAGVLMSDGKWDGGGSAGPGIYANAKVFENYKQAVNELATHIGVSHRALGKAKSGEAEGQKGTIIEQITAAQSVDFVTSPGAGGQVLQLFEAAKGTIEPPIKIEKEAVDMTEEEKKVLEAKLQVTEGERDTLKTEGETLKEENARLKEGQLLQEAAAFVAKELSGSQLPDLTKGRLTEILVKNPPVKEDKLDEATFKAYIKEVVDGEIEYLSKVTNAGAILGMGDAAVAQSSALKESFKAQYLKEGKPEDESERLAVLAAKGR